MEPRQPSDFKIFPVPVPRSFIYGDRKYESALERESLVFAPKSTINDFDESEEDESDEETKV